MRIYLTIILLFLSGIAHSQLSKTTLGSANTTDTGWLKGSIRIDDVIRALYYANTDTTMVLSVNAQGIFYLKNISGGGGGGGLSAIYNKRGTIIYNGDSIVVDSSIVMYANDSNKVKGYTTWSLFQTFIADSGINKGYAAYYWTNTQLALKLNYTDSTLFFIKIDSNKHGQSITLDFGNNHYYPLTGNPSGFLTSEVDPIFTSSVAYNITAVDTTHYNYAWLHLPVSMVYGTGTLTMTENNGSTFTATGFLQPGYFSATAPMAYNSSTGIFSMTQSGSAVDGWLGHIDYGDFQQAYNKYPTSGSYTSGTITITTRDGSTWTITGLPTSLPTSSNLEVVTTNGNSTDQGIQIYSMSATPSTPTSGNTIYSPTDNTLRILNHTNGFYIGINATGNTANRIYTTADHNFTLDNLSTSTTTTNGYFKGVVGLGTFVTSIGDGDIASSGNWNTAYTNRITSLTTTGSSGAATLLSNVLNIPTPTLAGLGGISSSYYTFSTGLSGSTTITANISTGISGGQTAIGGIGATDIFKFKSTTGNQVSGNSYYWLGGNNGASTLMSMDYLGNITDAAYSIGLGHFSSLGALTSSLLINADITNGTIDLTTKVNSNALPVVNGGLNKTSATQYDIPYATSTTAYGAIAIGTANQILSVNGSATGYVWIPATSGASTTLVAGSGISLLTGTNIYTVVNAYSTTPTATTPAGWDANSNMFMNNAVQTYSAVATSATVYTVTAASPAIIEFTGTVIQSVTMPVVSTLTKGFTYILRNTSSSDMNINTSNGSTTIISSFHGTNSLTNGQEIWLRCINPAAGTASSAWEYMIIPISHGVNGWSVGTGGTGSSTFTQFGVLLGNGATAFQVTAVGATNTVLSGNTGANPTFQSITSSFLPTGVTSNNQTGTTYTFVLGDRGVISDVTSNNASSVTFTVPPHSSVAYVTNDIINIINYGAGKLTIAPSSGVTINSIGGVFSITQYGFATLKNIGTDSWILGGNISN